MSVSSKLTQLQGIKEDIKEAIIAKGQEAGDDMTEYASLIDAIDTSAETQTKTVALDMENGNQEVTPDTNKVLSKVTVTKPNTMIPENIKKDITIGGVIGNYDNQKEEQSKTVTFSSDGQEVTPDAGKVLSKVTIDKPSNLIADNVKSGITIAGVTGNVTPAKVEQTKTVPLNMQNGDQVVAPDTNKVLTQVTIEKPSTLVASNIKKDINIGGVTGTFEGGISLNGIQEQFEVSNGKSVSAGDFIEYVKDIGDNSFGTVISGAPYTKTVNKFNIDANTFLVHYGDTSNGLYYMKVVKIDNDTVITGEAKKVYDTQGYGGLIAQLSNNTFAVVSGANIVSYFSVTDTEITLIYKNTSPIYSTSSYRISNIIGLDSTHALIERYQDGYDYGRSLAVLTFTNNSITAGSATNTLQAYGTSYYHTSNFVKMPNGQIMLFVKCIRSSYSNYLDMWCITMNGTTIGVGNKVELGISGYYTSDNTRDAKLIGDYVLYANDNRSTSRANEAMLYSFGLNQGTPYKIAEVAPTSSTYGTIAWILPLSNSRFISVEGWTAGTVSFNNWILRLYSFNNDGTFGSILNSYSVSGEVTLFALAEDEFIACLKNTDTVQHFKVLNDVITLVTPLTAKVYIQPAINTLGNIGVALENKTGGQNCNTCRVRTYYPATFNLTNLTSSNNNLKVNLIGTTNFSLIADTGYSLPNLLSVSGASIISYDSSTGAVVLASPTGNVTITAVGEEIPVAAFTQVTGTYDNSTYKTRLSDMDTSKIYTVGNSYGNVWGAIKYQGGSWVGDGVAVDNVSSTSCDFYLTAGNGDNDYFYQTEDVVVVLEGDSEATSGDFTGYSDNTTTGYWACYIEGTPITLADRTYKNVEDITYDDDLLVWGFDEGKFDKAKPLWIMKKQTATRYNHLVFSDGSELNTIGQHRIFNIEAGKFTYPMTDDTPIGTHTINDKGEVVTLVSKEYVEKDVNYYNIITDYHLNCFAGKILTSCRLNNLYPIEYMKFIKEERPAVYYNVPDRYYRGLRLAEQPDWEVISQGADNHGNSYEEYVNNLLQNSKEESE